MVFLINHSCTFCSLSCNFTLVVRYIYYRPQRSWGKVIFSQACVFLFTLGVCLSACWDTPPQTRHPPGANTPEEQTPPRSRHPCPPGSRHTPRSRHPLGADNPGADTPREQTPTPREQTPPRLGTPPGAEHAGRYGQCGGSTHPTGMQSCYPLVIIFGISAPKMVEGGQLRNVQKLMKNV